MSNLRDSLDSLRKKKEELREDVREAKEDLLSFRPRPLQNMARRRVHRLRNSVETGIGERLERVRRNLEPKKEE